MSNISPKSPGLVTIRYVVMSVLNRLSDYSMKSYMRYCQIAIEGFSEELSTFHVSAGMEVVYLHMSSAKTVPLPADFVAYNKIAYPIDGKLRVITRDDAILLPRVFDDTGEYAGNMYGGIPIGAGNVSDLIWFQDHYRSGRFIGGMFGLPGGIDRASFRIDMENRQIVFSGSTPRSEVVMEYVSSGMKTDGSSLIPKECVAPLRNYILWQKDESDPRVAYNAKQRLKQEYEESIEALRSFTNSFTAEEYRRMIFQTTYQSPKR